MDTNIIALIFEWAIPKAELNLMVVTAKSTIPRAQRVEGVDTPEKAKQIIDNFFDTGELPGD